MICPVRNASEEQKIEMHAYIKQAESQGHKIYYPARDTDQNDLVGYRICTDNKNAIVDKNSFFKNTTFVSFALLPSSCLIVCSYFSSNVYK